MPVAMTEPSALTGNTCSSWPWASTTYRSLFTLKAPLRVYTVCVDVRLGLSAKKPWPEMARSSAFKLDSMLPCVNCCLIDFRMVPEPMAELAACNGEVAKISPNSARDRLKPVVPVLAMLFEMAAISACAPFRPVSEV